MATKSCITITYTELAVLWHEFATAKTVNRGKAQAVTLNTKQLLVVKENTGDPHYTGGGP